jgi:hypothetical protein
MLPTSIKADSTIAGSSAPDSMPTMLRTSASLAPAGNRMPTSASTQPSNSKKTPVAPASPRMRSPRAGKSCPRSTTTGASAVIDAFASCEKAAAARTAPAWVSAASRSISCLWAASID